MVDRPLLVGLVVVKRKAGRKKGKKKEKKKYSVPPTAPRWATLGK